MPVEGESTGLGHLVLAASHIPILGPGHLVSSRRCDPHGFPWL